MTFAERLSALMEEKGWTKYYLSKLLNCHATSVSNWLSGTIPQKSMIKRLAEVFDVSEEYIKGETDERGQMQHPSPFGDGLTEEEARFLRLLRENAAFRATVEQMAPAFEAQQNAAHNK